VPSFPSRGDEPFPEDSAWQGEARALLERALRRHGGWSAWQRATGVSLVLVTLSGLLPAVKGLRRTFPMFRRVEVWPRDALAVFHDYPDARRRGVFRSGLVQLLDHRGEVAQEIADPRASFQGWRKVRRWSPIDALYFFGYALTHYHGLPFTLVDARPVRLRTARVQGRRLAGVEVELPPHVPTHCSRQTFYFGEDGLLLRHDYVAEIVGAWARGAHFWEDFTVVDDLPIARRRHVVGRIGRLATPVVALHAELADVSRVAAAAQAGLRP
jgi:hypothetical protein